MSPSISCLGTKAATESITMISIAPERTMVSAISNAWSPLSGCEIYNSSISTPMFFAYTGSSACSASIKPAIPPRFCTSAIICKVTVVLPLDSGPYTSMTLPFGTPPSPSAMSRLSEPVGTVSTEIFAPASPNFITVPLPKSFSNLDIAASSALFLSSFAMF